MPKKKDTSTRIDSAQRKSSVTKEKKTKVLKVEKREKKAKKEQKKKIIKSVKKVIVSKIKEKVEKKPKKKIEKENLEDIIENDNKLWYIIQCYAGQEHKVKERILLMIEEGQLGKSVSKILLPQEETIEIKNNKRLEKIVKLYPGYLFIKMDPYDEILYLLRRVNGVAKFIGSKQKPIPVQDSEILKILQRIGEKAKKIEVDFEVDETIKVTAGPFRGYTGKISEINGEKGKLKAFISIFGRETPVELDFNQVEKVIN